MIDLLLGIADAPRLKRIEFCARWLDRLIAFSTCDGSRVPEEHADPVETATPSRSSAISSDSASMRSKLMLVVFGTRASREPLTSVLGTADRMPFSSRSRSAASRVASDVHLLAAPRRPRRPCPTTPGDVLGSGPAVAFLLAAAEKRGEADPALHPQQRRRPSGP